MQRIVILGQSGTGKSTLARRLANHLDIPYLHIDTIFWQPGWVPLDKELLREKIKEFISKDKWVIDGNYSSSIEDRLELCDTVIFLNYNRFVGLYGALSRYFKYRGKVRESIGEGCQEKIDFEFVKWILWDFPRNKEEKLLSKLPKNKDIYIFNNRKQLNKWLRDEVGIEN